jgi:hypothetical protein
VEQQLAEAMEQLRGLGADMAKKREVSQRVKKLRKDIADRVRSGSARVRLLQLSQLRTMQRMQPTSAVQVRSTARDSYHANGSNDALH